MRSHAKARAAGSTKRTRAGRKPALLLVSVAACVAALVVVVGPASGATTRFLVEAFGVFSQPSFPADKGLAADQGTERLHVIDSTEDTLSRYREDGTPANFPALASNVIDGEGAGDATAHGHLAFESNRQREQVAIDESGEATDGNIYVTQSSQDVVDIFSSEGEYLGQLSESTGTGAFGEPCGVAVDSEGTVYVGDRGDDRIHVFEPEALAAAPVNADNTASFETVTDPCTMAAGAGATAGFLFVNASTGAQLRKVDAATGEVKYQLATGASTVSVDPATGHVFAARNTGTSSSVDEYDASGAAEASLVSSFKPGSTVEGIALDSTGEQVYVARSGTENVEVFGPAAIVPDVVTSPPSSNTGTRATLAGTVNPDGVELDECFFEWKRGTSGLTPFDQIAPCAETPAEIGSGTTPVAVHADISGLAPQGSFYTYRLVAANLNAPVNGSNQQFKTPNTVIAEAASGITPTEATLNGTINPDTATISDCVFEWGPEKGPFDLVQIFPETAPCVPGPGGITGTSPVAVQAGITGLHPGTTYVYRLKAAYPTGPVTHPEFAPLSLQTTGPVIKASWTEDVVFAEAILKTEINPAGSPTTYHIEYGETEAYGSQTPELAVGSDSSLHQLSRFLTGLKPGTTYHYRVVATNVVATNEGPDLTFTTFEPFVQETDCTNQVFRGGSSAHLPDCRAYEMVSLIDKNGGGITTACNINCHRTALNQASVDGEKMTYSSFKAFGDALGAPYSSQYLASRGGDGWSTHAINPLQPGSPVDFGNLEIAYAAFTEDLSIGWRNRELEGGLLRLETLADSFQLVPGTASKGPLNVPRVTDHSRGGDHVTVSTSAVLTPDAPVGSNSKVYDITADGQSHLVSVLPNGTPNSANSVVGYQSSQYRWREGTSTNAMSEDGSVIYWSGNTEFEGDVPLYVRLNPDEEQSALSGSECTEPEKACTIPVATSAKFRQASIDGSAALYTSSAPEQLNTLHRFDLESATSTLIAPEVYGVLSASDDLSYVYFLSRADLGEGAITGERNLYVDHEGSITYIATLAAPDTFQGAVPGYSVVARKPIDRPSRVTPDGRHLAFQSVARLTGYDNTAANGEPAVEVYTYDAETQELTCASCNPSGARPLTKPYQLPFRAADAPATDNGGTKRLWTAAWLTTAENQLYTPRALSEDGNRLFFNAFDALVPWDTNGQQDVYEWRAQGTAGCSKPDGCVDLISSGVSPDKSEFVDATPDGSDVFFETKSSLLPQDPSEIDIYDARIGGGFPQPPAPPRCFGDACQSVPPAPNDQTPASASFHGAGDPSPRPNCAAAARRAAKLSRRAKRLRQAAKRVRVDKRSKALRRRSARSARKARGLSRSAARCRRASRRAAR